MPVIRFQDVDYSSHDQETVLECLERHGVSVPSSCRSGVCQTCLMRALEGSVPAAAQQGLKDTLRAQNYFLACVCKPRAALNVALAGADITHHMAATVLEKTPLARDIVRLRLRVAEPLDYRPGQFLNLVRADGLVRSYSLASHPALDGGVLEFHIRHLSGGQMSTWLCETLAVGDTLSVEGPLGDCYYLPGAPQRSLLLIGTGTGLAPLWGIVRDALSQGHEGPIHLYHGSYRAAGLYLVDELRELARRHANFFYTPCVDEGEAGSIHTIGRADQVALADHPQLKDWRIYLCGHPEMVAGVKKKAFLAGASLGDIYADPFVYSVPGSPAEAEARASTSVSGR